MNYEINVAKNGTHYFATDERSLTTERAARDMYRHFLELFPESEGYSITVRYWQTTGQDITAGLKPREEV